MTTLLSRPDYEREIAESRDRRMKWWRDARFGMFIHYGLYAQVGRNEWVMSLENYPIAEYEKLADDFRPRPEAPGEWAQLAKKAGMKYMVMTTRHHDGFSLWDSKVNPYNSTNYGSGCDVVKEFVEACRDNDLKIGFYSSLMDWHHPDGWRCAFDSAARTRFTEYLTELNRELMTQYGKIDILWYDVSAPMQSWEGWDSLERNQIIRELQPEIIINNRSKLDEDFGTPEGHVTAEDRDWEACMTFNDISWGYVDSVQAAPYSYNTQRIIKMLNKATAGSGNLLLNIGPMPDGSVPEEAVSPLTETGDWLEENAEAVHGPKARSPYSPVNGVSGSSWDGDRKVYVWNYIWPGDGKMGLGGFMTPVRSIRLLKDGSPVKFEQKGHRIILQDLPDSSPDRVAGIAVLEVEFEQTPEFRRASYYPQLHAGEDFAGENKV